MCNSFEDTCRSAERYSAIYPKKLVYIYQTGEAKFIYRDSPLPKRTRGTVVARYKAGKSIAGVPAKMLKYKYRLMLSEVDSRTTFSIWSQGDDLAKLLMHFNALPRGRRFYIRSEDADEMVTPVLQLSE